MRRLRVDRVVCTRSACPGICAIIPLYGKRAVTAHFINIPNGLCEPGGHMMSRFHERSAS